MGAVNSRVLAEAHHAASHGGPSQSQFATALDDGDGQVSTVPEVLAADVNRQLLGSALR